MTYVENIFEEVIVLETLKHVDHRRKVLSEHFSGWSVFLTTQPEIPKRIFYVGSDQLHAGYV